jgi:hypothetical protein
LKYVWSKAAVEDILWYCVLIDRIYEVYSKLAFSFHWRTNQYRREHA